MKKWLIILMLLLCAMTPSSLGETIKYDLYDIQAKSNSIHVNPGDNIEDKMDELVNKWGPFDHFNRGKIIFNTGKYSPTAQIEYDHDRHEFIDWTGDGSATITGDSLGDVNVVHKTTLDACISGVNFSSDGDSRAGLCVDNTVEGNDMTISLYGGKGTYSVSVNDLARVLGAWKGDNIQIWGGDIGVTPQLITITDVNLNGPNPIYICNPLESGDVLIADTNISYEWMPNASIHSDFEADTTRATMNWSIPNIWNTGYDYAYSGVHFTKNGCGNWYNIKTGHNSFCGGAYYSMVGHYENITARLKFMGSEACWINCTVIYCKAGDYAIGGCGFWGAPLGNYARILYNLFGANSIARGRTIYEGAIVRGNICDSNSIAGCSVAYMTGVSGTDSAETVLTKTDAFDGIGTKICPQFHGRPGSHIYISDGTNAVVGFYEVKSIDDVSSITLTSNASSGGAMSDITFHYFCGWIKGDVENNIVTGGKSSYAMGTGGRVTGLVINNRLGSIDDYIAGVSSATVYTYFAGACSNNAPPVPIAKTASFTVSQFNSGGTYSNAGATEDITATLCAPYPSLDFGINVVEPNTVTLDPGSYQIREPNGVTWEAGDMAVFDPNSTGRIRALDTSVWQLYNVTGTYNQE